MSLQKWPLVAVLVGVLAGCGGGGGGGGVGGDPVPMALESDVVRELVNLDPASYYDTGLVAKSADGQMHLRSSRRLGPWHSITGGGASRSKAATVHDCSSGTDTEDSETGVRKLKLFDVSRTFDYTSHVYDNCVITDSSSYSSYDGYGEDGDNWAYAAGSTADPKFDYSIVGQDGVPLVIEYGDAEGSLSFTTLGWSETKDTGALVDYREAFAGAAEFTNPSFTAEFTSGTPGSPFRVVRDFNVDSVTLNGVFTYATSMCEGGTVRYTTNEPLTFNPNTQEETFINGGKLTIATRNAVVTLTFTSDGSATYQIRGGATGTITRQELADAPGCAPLY